MIFAKSGDLLCKYTHNKDKPEKDLICKEFCSVNSLLFNIFDSERDIKVSFGHLNLRGFLSLQRP